MRVIQFPARDSMLGDHNVRVLVAPDDQAGGYILSGQYDDIADFNSDLLEIGYDYLKYFRETLRYNNAPDWYDAGFLVSQLDSSIPFLIPYYTTDTVLAPTVNIFGEPHAIESTVSIDSGNRYTTVSIHNEGGINTIIQLDNNPYGGSYACYITIPVMKESLIDNHGDFDIPANAYCGRLMFTVVRTLSNKYSCSVTYTDEWTTVPTVVRNSLNGNHPDDVDDIDDPYDPGNDDPSGGGGGGGNHDNDSDPITEPSLPTLSAVASGFINIYAPTVQQIRDLAGYMWGSLTDLDAAAIRKIVADPMDVILGLSIVPVSVPTSGSETIKVGGISTSVSMNKASSQYVKVECGSISLKEYWGSFMDYTPYTKILLYLPFIGYVDLNVDIVQTTTLKVTYHVDILSGGCIAFIMSNNNVIAQYSGQCSVSIPISSSDFTQTVMAMGQLAASGISFIATGGLSAPVSAATIGAVATAAASTAGTVSTAKPRFNHSGNLSGGSGLLGSRKPYVVIQRPRMCLPVNQNHYQGYPSYITKTLGELSGFTQVQSIKLDGISCTDAERNEILSLLTNGVVL